ncbi:L-serine ammonia-lyase [Heterostelium album PN500]|uniref:L-serine ammonia-lyase n=1 Tax=Heterostelium pallidum (strain ATCC 26659 / Pp 5 / PN500) TaxID=670386 RepID=D3B7Q8_HETP5|nr:L-serine ammonia-lyase [Heterostelium album PN500]EFA82801.1 L-serine ammonia-lyase [Heterostelium album PN500]|eukprot:XP_020434918.1 L-serine ammonia-lyase [Heterostelium album PN500]
MASSSPYLVSSASEENSGGLLLSNNEILKNTKLSLHINSPLVESLALNQVINAGNTSGTPIRVWAKMDALQPSGSFKIRGVGLHCSRAVNEKGVKHLICSSGGNAGKSVAYAGRCLGVKTTIVLPSTIPLETRQKIQAEGADVLVHGAIWDEADVLARQIAEREGVDGYIHPFNHPDLWEGHSTLIDEVYQSVQSGHAEKPDVIICSVGGGGLLVGLVNGLHRVGWHDVPIVAVETHGAKSLAGCFQVGHHTKLDASEVTSICKTLATRAVCEEAWDCTKRHRIIPVQVSDLAAVEACLKFVDDERVLVEPACGASLAIIYQLNEELLKLNPKNILSIVCGGNNTSIKQLFEFQQSLKEKELTSLVTEIANLTTTATTKTSTETIPETTNITTTPILTTNITSITA